MSNETLTLASELDEPRQLGEAEIQALNYEFAQLSPTERVERASEIFGERLVLPNSFGPTAPVMLKLVTETIPDVPVVTIRHGYETDRTLELADWYQRSLRLNLLVYEAPRLPIPPDGTEEFEDFQRQVKVEPFQQILSELQPRAYFSGRMRWQSDGRADLPFVQDRGSVIVINPVADLSAEAVADFFARTGLPANDDYFDPAKGQDQRAECQLNTTIYKHARNT